MQKFIDGIKKIFSKRENVFFLLIFFVSLCTHLYASFIGWNNSLLDEFGFRQTQTAITTYYTIKEGFHLNYITPVLGAPWSIPMEFPLFQWIVALAVIFLKTPLDQTGRFFSLFFFYLTLFPLYSILGMWLKKANYKLIILSLLLLNPTYLFWPRTFMIESLALFLTVLFGWLIMKYLSQKREIYLPIAVLIGCLAALTKITTFVALVPALSFIFGYHWYRENEKRPSADILKKYFSFGIILFGIPLLAAIFWNHYADIQKALNPIANGFITSNSLKAWNYGTFSQKISWSTWLHIFENSLIPFKLLGQTNYANIIIPNFLFFVILAFYYFKKYRYHLILSFVFFLIGPIIFTNLYFVHNYYFYANNFFLSILLGFFVISLIEMEKQSLIIITSLIIFPFLLLSLWREYKTTHYPIQISPDNSILAPAKIISENTSEDSVILIYASDWNPSLAYYSRRKTIMDWKYLPLSDPQIDKALNNSGRDRISAMVICEKKDQEFINERILSLNLLENPAYAKKNIKVYLKKNY